MLADFLLYLSLVGIGCAAGFINVIAGGGSLLTLPFLIFMGLSPATANGTNRIAILLQNISATIRFQRYQVIPKEISLVTIIPAILGAVLGAQLASQINELLFKQMLAVIMVLVMGLMFFTPGQKTTKSQPVFSIPKKAGLAAVFFLIGIYGGFIQGGVGFLLITALTLVGYDLVHSNALKILVVLAFTPLALFVFVINNQVDYQRGLVLACGNVFGAWLATKVVVTKGHDFIRWLVMAAGVLFAIKLFYFDLE